MKPAREITLSPRRRLLFSTILALGLLLALEVLARGYLRLFSGGSLLHPDRVIYGFYPELRSVIEERESETDTRDAAEILLLGGSALHPRWGAVEALIAERLTAELRRPVRMHNLAMPGHTTRDSLLKYERLAGQRPFDLVIIYHGINETRTNNAPPEVYRDDYGHYSWYRFVNAIDRDRLLPVLALPYTVKHVAMTLADAVGWTKIVPADGPLPEWLAYGVDVKSAAAVRHNLAAILDIAQARGERVLMMTFAIDIAEGYSREKFEAMQLAYTRHRSPLWWWGTIDGVRNGVAAHNLVIRELGAERGCLLVDQAALMPQRRENFNDVCHLTVTGSEAFVDNMMPALREAIAPPAR